MATCDTGDPGDIGLTGSGSTPGQPGGGGGTGGQGVGLPDTYAIYSYAPACTGNTRTDTGVICASAVTTCTPVGRGLIAYWVWKATYVRATRSIQEPPGWVMQPGSVCLGPNDPGVPSVAAVAGVVSRDFKDLVVRKGQTHVQPAGTTLVQYDTGFWTEAGTYTLDAVQVLGHRVVVTAKAERYDWYFGDGTTALDAGPGRAGGRDVHHVYVATGAVRPHVEITWSGTFTVDGGAALDVVGTAQTVGNGTALQVRQARAELVS